MLSMSTVNAQFYGNGCSSCGTSAVAPMSYASAACTPVSTPAIACTPIQPVQTTCYQQVPVTTFRQDKQTVKVPYYETSYEEREVTVMRPVTKQRQVEVPTVSYQNVTEYRTVNRDMGRWVTQYNPVHKSAPCQVDPRPGMIGWLNRTGYSFRTAFQPNYTTTRQYVPQMMACSVPVTRQVAVRGTQRMTVNETHMVADRKMERVPVQKLAYREETRTVMTPQTAYRTVPIGTQLTYGYGGYGVSSATAFAPIIDSRTALGPEPDPISRPQTARRNDEPFAEDDDRYERPERRRTAADKDDHLHPSSRSRELAPAPNPRRFSDDSDPLDDNSLDFPDMSSRRRRSESLVIPASFRRTTGQSQERRETSASQWKRTSPRTAMRRSSRSGADKSAVTLTQKSGN